MSDETLIAWTSRAGGAPTVLALGRDGSELVVLWERPLGVPDWVMPGSGTTIENGRFRISAPVAGRNTVEITREAHARYAADADDAAGWRGTPPFRRRRHSVADRREARLSRET